MHRSRALLTVKMHLGIHQTSFGNTKDFDHADSAVKLILLLSEQQNGHKSPGMPQTSLGNSKTFVPTAAPNHSSHQQQPEAPSRASGL